MQPKLFTLIFSAKDAETVIVTHQAEGDVPGAALGAEGADTILVVPTCYWHDGTQAADIIARSRESILCTPNPEGGLSAQYVAVVQDHVPTWARRLANRLDTGKCRERRAAAQQRREHEIYGLEFRARVVA